MVTSVVPWTIKSACTMDRSKVQHVCNFLGINFIIMLQITGNHAEE